MPDPVVKKFMLFFKIPLATMDDWKKTEPQQSEAAEKNDGEIEAMERSPCRYDSLHRGGRQHQASNGPGLEQYAQRHCSVFHGAGRLTRGGGTGLPKPTPPANPQCLHSGHGSQAHGWDVARHAVQNKYLATA